MNESIPRHPAPWALTGWGLIATWFSRQAREAAMATLTESQRARYAGGPVLLMLVRYAQSDCGPYDELLFVPGRLKTPNGPRPVISRIWVSTQDSVVNGRINWAIPKQLADFEFEMRGEAHRSCRVRAEGLDANIRFKPGRMALPVSTGLLPAGLRTLRQPVLPEQGQAADFCETTVEASGKSRPARNVQMDISGGALPNSMGKPALSLLAEPFNMTFPRPRFV